MPNRLLRNWTLSGKVNALSANAERYFTRLVMTVDDYGCFHADTRILKAQLFPLLNDIREADITRWTAECQKAGLIVVYEYANKRYLQILDFGQRLRLQTHKYPLPSDDGQMTVMCQSDDGHVTGTGRSDDGVKRREVEEKGREPRSIDRTPPSIFSDDEIKRFEKFQEFINEEAPNVGKMKQPFTIEQYLELKKRFPTNELREMCLKMHNWKPLLRRNMSAYLTFLSWSSNQYNQKTESTNGNSINEQLKAALAGN